MRSGEEKEEEEEKEIRKKRRLEEEDWLTIKGVLDPKKIGAIMGGFVLYCKFRFPMYIYLLSLQKRGVYTPFEGRGGFSHHHHGWFCPVIAHRLWLL